MATVVFSAFLMSGCANRWSRSTSLDIRIQLDLERNARISWGVREEVAQDISKFEVEIFVLSQDGKWIELFSENMVEEAVYTGSRTGGLWTIRTYRHYRFDIYDIEICYGVYKIRSRSMNHQGRHSRWTEYQQGMFITGRRFAAPTNLRLEGNVLHWNSEGTPNPQLYIPEHAVLPSSPVGTKEHRYKISIDVYDGNMTRGGGTIVSKTRNSINISSYISGGRDITIWVRVLEGVYDFVLFHQSDRSEPLRFTR